MYVFNVFLSHWLVTHLSETNCSHPTGLRWFERLVCMIGSLHALENYFIFKNCQNLQPSSSYLTFTLVFFFLSWWSWKAMHCNYYQHQCRYFSKNVFFVVFVCFHLTYRWAVCTSILMSNSNFGKLDNKTNSWMSLARNRYPNGNWDKYCYFQVNQIFKDNHPLVFVYITS